MADYGTIRSSRMTLSPQQATAGSHPLIDRLTQAEEELDRLHRGLERAQRLALLGGLAACTAHEINNLLSPVLVAAQLAQANPGDTELARKAVARAVEGVMSASGIAGCVLDFASHSDDDRAVADVREAIDAAVRCLARDPAKDGIVLTVEAERGLIAAIPSLALQQVVLNLILNAVEALRKVEVRRLEIFARAADGSVVITVRDNGPGVPSELRDRLFRPIADLGIDRCDGENNGGSSRGHGLGLAVCKLLVERSGGSIVLDPNHALGATFHVRIPIKIQFSKAARDAA